MTSIVAPEVSVVLPAYNVADKISEQLSALAHQEFKGSWEVVVADNRSRDGTNSVVLGFKDRIPDLRLVTAAGVRNAANARNHGVKAARGTKLLFCDADDRVGVGWVSTMAKALDRHDLVVGMNDIRVLNPLVRSWGPQSCSGNKNELGFLPYAITCNCGITRQAFQRAGGFSIRYDRGEDIDLSWRLILMGVPIHIVSDALVYHRMRDTDLGAWRQWVSIGIQDVRLFVHYKKRGLRRDPFATVLRKYRWLLLRLPQLFVKDFQKRRLWIHRMGRSWGRIIGSFRWMRFFL